MKLLLVDNYDSFTYNLVHLFAATGAEITVLRNDDDALDEAAVAHSDAVVLGPGPGRPSGSGRTLATIGHAVIGQRPVFGVCLGLQAVAQHFGGRVDHAPALVHGKTSAIEHDGSGVFEGLASPLQATRYHSLCARDLPPSLRVVARSEDGVVQALVHRRLPIHAVQFHPESILTVTGSRIAANFVSLAAR